MLGDELRRHTLDDLLVGKGLVLPDYKALLIGRLYNRRKKAATDGGKGVPKKTDGQNDQRLSTAETIAAEHNVSPKTVLAAKVTTSKKPLDTPTGFF